MQLGGVSATRMELADLLAEQGRLKRGDAVALCQNLRGQRLVAVLERREEAGLASDGGAGRPRPGHGVRVLLGDPVHEVDLFDELGEAVGIEDHADEIRLAVLVVGDEVGGQSSRRALELVLEIDQAVARRQETVLYVAELCFARAELLLELAQSPVGVGQTVRGLPDLGAVGRDLRFERGRRRLAGRDLALKVSGAAARQAAAEQYDRRHERDDPGGSGTYMESEHADGCGHGKADARPTGQAPRSR